MEVEIGGNKYKTGKLDSFQQLHVARRLGPVLVTLSEGADKLGEPPEGATFTFTDVLVASAVPFAQALAKMSDADLDYVVKTCLQVCLRASNGAWAKVWTPSGMMFSDIDMQVMLSLTLEVVGENIGGFFPSAVAPSQASAPSQPPTS